MTASRTPTERERAAWLANDLRLNAAYDALDAAVAEAWWLSGALKGQKFGSLRLKHAYISLSKAAALGTNILRLTHKIGAAPPDVILDESSVFPLCRGMLEGLAVFYYLSGEDISDDERAFRLSAFDVYDAARRSDLLRLLINATPEERGEDALNARRAILDQDPVFQKLSADRRDKLRHGWKAPFNPEDVATRAGIDRPLFEAAFRLFSEYTHAGPLAFTRWEEDRVPGWGVAHRRRNIAFGLEVTCVALTAMNRHYRRLNPAAAAEVDSAQDKPTPFWRSAC